MSTTARPLALAALAVAVASSLGPHAIASPRDAAAAQPPAPDKSAYTLVNPTPRELRRAMSPDRPDVTESPRTVDAGAVLLEMSFAEYTRDDRHAPRTDAWSIAPFNLKLGILNNADVQLVFEPYLQIDTHDDGSSTAEGLGNLTLRTKINLWGNDEGDTALALMPFISIPTGDDDVATDQVEGGLVIPFAMGLPGGWELGLMAVPSVVDDGEGGHTAEVLHTIELGRGLIGDLGGYVEYVGILPLEAAGSRYRALFSTGLTYSLTPDLQLDAGLRIGLTGPQTDDLTVFAGVSVRF